jgi:hypothetical protein
VIGFETFAARVLNCVESGRSWELSQSSSPTGKYRERLGNIMCVSFRPG